MVHRLAKSYREFHLQHGGYHRVCDTSRFLSSYFVGRTRTFELVSSSRTELDETMSSRGGYHAHTLLSVRSRSTGYSRPHYATVDLVDVSSALSSCVIQFSATFSPVAPEKGLVQNVHGVRACFLQAKATPTDGGVYFIGKLLWSKG